MSKSPQQRGQKTEEVVMEDSFVKRRALFKDIWEAAGSDMEGSADEQTIKPKVIKTLRLDELDYAARRKKTQRIKNLRLVCKKILEFCDRQENEDTNFQINDEQAIADSNKRGSSKAKKSKNRKPKELSKKMHQISEDKMGMIEKVVRKLSKSPNRLPRVPEEPTKVNESSTTSALKGNHGKVRKVNLSKLKKKFSYSGSQRNKAQNNKNKSGPITDISGLDIESGP